MSSYTRIQLEQWLKKIDVIADRVLDVGGAQNPVSFRVNRWEVRQYEIFDLPEPHMTHEAVNKNIPLIMGNIEHGFDPSLEGKYDIVFCLEVMEYILNPTAVVENLKRLLKPGGILYISFPFIYPHHSPFNKDYLRYTRWGAERLLLDAGFFIEVKPRKAMAGGLENFYSEEGMRRSKEFTDHDDVGYMVKAVKA